MEWTGFGVAVLLATCLLLQDASVEGCSCLPPGPFHPQKFYCDVPVLFVGEVLTSVSTNITITAEVKVLKIIKDPQNQLVKGGVVEVITCDDIPCCGYGVTIGSKYLMHKLVFSYCDRYMKPVEVSGRVKAIVRKMKKICKCCNKCKVEVCDGTIISQGPGTSRPEEECPSHTKVCTYDIRDPKASCYVDFGVCCNKKGKCQWKRTKKFKKCLAA